MSEVGAFCYLRKNNRPIKQFGYHSSERLKKRKAIDALFTGGKSFSVYPFRIFYRSAAEATEPAGAQPLQVGVGVSKRHFKRAVDRNRIKRLTREAYRTQKQLLLDLLPEGKKVQLFFIFTGKELPPFELVRKRVADALGRLQKEMGVHA